MEIKIKTSKEYRQLQEFLAAMVVNKGLFWALHFKTEIERLRKLGVEFWGESETEKGSAKWAAYKAKKYGTKGLNVATGQTREQAEFATGDLDTHMTGRGNVLTNINAAPWVPNKNKGAPAWKAGPSFDNRPFWGRWSSWPLEGGKKSFWRPGSYIDLKNVSKNIWKSELPGGEVSLKEAQQLLIMSVNQTRKILRRESVALGNWQQGKTKGVASRWR